MALGGWRRVAFGWAWRHRPGCCRAVSEALARERIHVARALAVSTFHAVAVNDRQRRIVIARLVHTDGAIGFAKAAGGGAKQPLFGHAQ